MKLFWKVLLIAFALALIFVLGFEFWGSFFETLLDRNQCVTWLAEGRSYAWVFGIAFLAGDLILPIPATGVMAALGAVYGFWLGSLLSIIGSAGAGLAGYFLARLAGKRATRFLATDKELVQFNDFFNSWGGGAIIISRILPILPEVISILAGLANMNFSRFLVALMLGTVPVCLLFVFLGANTYTSTPYAIVMASLLPLALWPIFLKFVLPKVTTKKQFAR